MSRGAALALLLAVGCKTELAPELMEEDPAATEPPPTGEAPPTTVPNDTPPTPDPVTPPTPDPDPPECGPNSSVVGLECVCDTVYSFCDPNDTTGGCCAYGVDTFAITLVSAEVLPFKDPVDESPWDWSGFVPGWMRDLISDVIVYTVEDAEDWVGILDFVFQFAPELLHGSTPPDPFVELELGGHRIDETSVVDDDYEPVWNETFTVTVPADQALDFAFLDEDLDFDDDIAFMFVTQDTLQNIAGLGPLTFNAGGGLYSFTMAVEPAP